MKAEKARIADVPIIHKLDAYKQEHERKWAARSRAKNLCCEERVRQYWDTPNVVVVPSCSEDN